MPLEETIRRIRRFPIPDSEEMAKLRIILPVLNDLGWDTTGPEVIPEYQVGHGRSGGRVDLALKGPQRVVALIEAKAPREALNRHVAQVLVYAFHEGLNICALTSGLEWRLYLPKEDGPPEERCFANLDLLDDPIEQIVKDLETFLSKGNLLSGRAEHRAAEVLAARRQDSILKRKLPEIWSRMVTKPDERLVELVKGQAYEELNLRPSAEQVKAVLRNLPVPAVPKPAPTCQGMTPKDTTSTTPLRRSQEGMSDLERRIVGRYQAWNSGTDRSRENSSRLNSLLYSWFKLAEEDRQMTVRQMAEHVGKSPSTLRFRADRSDQARTREGGKVTRVRREIEAYILWDQRHPVTTWAAMLVGVAEALYQRHGASFDRILTLRGTTRIYASRNRDDISYNPKPVGASGIYIETHGNVADKIRRAGQFLELFGHSPDDLRIETQTG